MPARDKTVTDLECKRATTYGEIALGPNIGFVPW